jgi:leader peptidase (prepilin peptidase)/N-methyltransferase
LNLLLAATGLAHAFVLARPGPLDAGLGAVAGGLVLLVVALLFRYLRGRDGLGMGDQKFAAAAGLWIGWQAVPLMLLVASVSALSFVAAKALWRRQIDLAAPLPFGPFLCLGTLCAWLILVWS